MKKASAVFLLFLFLVPALAFAHAGEVHSYLGTITTLHEDGSFMLKKTDGKTIHVAVSKNTVYVHADGHAARRAEVLAGKRVSVTIARDGKTATKIKLAAVKKTATKK